MPAILQVLRILWAGPYTIVGLVLGIVGLCTGGSAQRRGPTIEFYGGAVQWLILQLPDGQRILAFTLGHTVLGQTAASLDVARAHEWVHVRQFERWGPLMGPAYVFASLYQWIVGGRPYRDNCFEREAYGTEGEP